uniref:Uncharacterized protein n=1 Tax=Vespula pensylvanica TaxID=30213 RepID=A0A834K831_VESPE|nr:hypothetical protein H0235_015831 [Vespula pensylvanica]
MAVPAKRPVSSNVDNHGCAILPYYHTTIVRHRSLPYRYIGKRDIALTERSSSSVSVERAQSASEDAKRSGKSWQSLNL